jgi:peptide subunit release factor RF-3
MKLLNKLKRRKRIMDNKITITASDGRYFYGTLTNYATLVGEVNAYESNLKLKKQKEQEERAKAVAEQKKKDGAKEKVIKSVTEAVDLVNQAVEKYENETGDKIYFVTVNGKLVAKRYSTLSNGLIKDFFRYF